MAIAGRVRIAYLRWAQGTRCVPYGYAFEEAERNLESGEQSGRVRAIARCDFLPLLPGEGGGEGMKNRIFNEPHFPNDPRRPFFWKKSHSIPLTLTLSRRARGSKGHSAIALRVGYASRTFGGLKVRDAYPTAMPSRRRNATWKAGSSRVGSGRSRYVIFSLSFRERVGVRG